MTKIFKVSIYCFTAHISLKQHLNGMGSYSLNTFLNYLYIEKQILS